MNEEVLIFVKRNFISSRNIIYALDNAAFNYINRLDISAYIIFHEGYKMLDFYSLNSFQRMGYSFQRFGDIFSFEIQLDFIDYWITYNKLNIFS